MKRDMELIRKILFKIEEDYISTELCNLSIEDHSIEEVAYHCKLLYEAGLVDNYSPKYAGNKLFMYQVGGLTWNGHDFLDKIREDKIWSKTKDVIVQKGLPMVLEVIKEVATGIISSMTEGAVKGLTTI